MDRSPTSCDILLKGGRLDCGEEGAGGSVVGAPYKSSSSTLDLTAWGGNWGEGVAYDRSNAFET